LAGGRTVRSGIHKLINSIRNREQLPEQCQVSITVLVYKKGNKTCCSNYRGISILSTT